MQANTCCIEEKMHYLARENSVLKYIKLRNYQRLFINPFLVVKVRFERTTLVVLLSGIPHPAGPKDARQSRLRYRKKRLQYLGMTFSILWLYTCNYQNFALILPGTLTCLSHAKFPSSKMFTILSLVSVLNFAKVEL